jgi:aspartyl-tRNA(Asn)/glutamyl-tRNA(Gln) amidotransferase subunit A
MAADDLLWRSALELAALIRTKQVSPVEVTDLVLARLEALNQRLNAFCHVAAEAARAAAREAEIAVIKGEPLGLLHGVPFSVKDVLETRGIPTTHGSRLFADSIPDRDAVAVGRLRAGGAVILGKTATSEFAQGHHRAPCSGHAQPVILYTGGSSGRRRCGGSGSTHRPGK